MIKKILQSMKSRKISIMMVLVIFAFVGLCFADNPSSENSLTKIITWIIWSLSWLWIIFANLAGKFMTNSVVYGSFLNLDAFFIRWWDFMRNIANFTLVFLLIYKIVEALIISKETTKLKEAIKKTLIAGVLIQASWFLIWATLDVSTILISSLGTIPAQVISSNKSLEKELTNNLQNLIKDKSQFIIDSEGISIEPKWWEKITKDNITSLVDTILPTEKSLSGPLLFLGISVMRLQDKAIPKYEDNFSEFLLSLTTSFVLLVVFTLIMFLLFVFNFLRVFALWVVIPLSPLLILIKVMDVRIKSEGWFKWFFDITNAIKLIFMPVVFVIYLSVVMIFLISIKGILSSGNIGTFYDPQSDVSISEEVYTQWENTWKKSSFEVGEIFSFTMKSTKDTFADILLFIFTIFLLWKLVMMTFQQKTGFSFIDNTMKGLTDISSKLITSVPVIPIGWKGNLSLGWIKQWLNGLENPKFLSDERTRQRGNIDSLFWNKWIEERAKVLIDKKDARAFYDDATTRKELIEFYGGEWYRLSTMPLIVDWVKQHKFSNSNTDIIMGVNLPTQINIAGNAKNTVDILRGFGFDDSWEYEWNVKSNTPSPTPPA